MKPDKSQMMKFKKIFHQDRQACFQTFSKHADRKGQSDHFNGFWNEETRITLISANKDERMEIGMVINRCDGNGRRAANATEIHAVYIDCDDGTMSLEQLRALAVAPDVIVETSPRNFHAYWLIKGCEVKRFTLVQKALAPKFGTDARITDPSRAMRMPGTINWKREKPYLAKLVHINDDAKPMRIDRFIQKMKLQIETDEAQAPSGPSSTENQAGLRLTPAMRNRIVAALDGVSADDREIWLRFGMAIHSEDCSEDGYQVWTNWSRTSSKFDESDQRKTWGGFKPHGGINIDSLFWLANRMKAGGSSALDEMSLAELYAATCSDVLRFEREEQKWRHFDGVVWKLDSQAPMRLARQFVNDLSSNEKGAMADAVKRFRTTAGMRNIVNQAELLDEMLISSLNFDRSPDEFAVKNGVVNLRTGTCRNAMPEDYLRRMANVKYDPLAKCPTWIDFMKSVTGGDREYCEYIRRALGYTLFGDADLQVFFLAIGSGGNGKGTMMRTVQKIMGDYAVSVAPNLLTSAFSGNANAPTPALVALRGARMVVCTETILDRRFDDAFIKQFAGGDEISARPTYGDTFAFKPEGKLWLSSNHMPEISSDDHAMWRRLKPLPFDGDFRGQKMDKDLEKKFAAEQEGIFNWVLKGARDYAASGLGNCVAAQRFETEMRNQADSVLAWISECCAKKASREVQSSLAYDSYLEFMKRLRRKPLNQPAFRASLEDKGFPHKRKNTGNVFMGLQLRNMGR